MEHLPIPTTANPRTYRRFSFDDISITSPTTDEFFDGDSFVYNPSFSSSETSIASYKTERTINSRKSRYNTLPRHKYAGIERLRLPRGTMSLDVDGASAIETDLQDDSDEATKATAVARTRERSMETHQEYEAPIDDIIQTVKRFRFLLIGRSGVGKSSLINCLLGINDADRAHVTGYKPGEADIWQELVSPQNQDFILHDSKSLEPGDLSNFETVRDFVQQRSRHELPLSERIQGLWLCTETPTAGGRVFEETGDEELLQFAHKTQVPILIVFTQYDRLVRTKEAELRQKYPDMEPTGLRDQSVEEARKAFLFCLQLLKRSIERLGIQMPRYATASVRPGHRVDFLGLVQATRDIVKERLKSDAWVMWAIAQRESIPVKIDACVTKGISYYRQALTGSVPELGQLLLRECLGKVHKDIISCWNFQGEVLDSSEFQQLMLWLVQDVYTNPTTAIRADVDKIAQFVAIITALPAPIFPPVAILGTTYAFVQWLSIVFLEKSPSIHQLLIAYTVDLILILRELFDITLPPGLALRVTWTELQEAVEVYERSGSRQRIHHRICSKLPQSGPVLTTDDISSMVHELLQDK